MQDPNSENVEFYSKHPELLELLVKQIAENKQGINQQIKVDTKLHNKPIFLYEFYVFDLYLPQQVLININQPVLAVRFMDFPTLTLSGNVHEEKSLIRFNQGKSNFFEMEVDELKTSLLTLPLYIMFIDMNFGKMQILASSKLNISLFAKEKFLNFHPDSSPPKPLRNILYLFDNNGEKICEFEVCIIVRREYFLYDNRPYPLKQENAVIASNVDNRRQTLADTIPFENNMAPREKIYSHELRPQSTDAILNGDHIGMTMKEKTEKNFNRKRQMNEAMTQTLNQSKTSFFEQSQNNSYSQQQNQNPYQSYQTGQTGSLNVTNTGFIKQPVVNKNNVRDKRNITLNDMINASDRNPPPLFFDHKKEQPSEKVKIVKVYYDNSNKRYNDTNMNNNVPEYLRRNLGTNNEYNEFGRYDYLNEDDEENNTKIRERQTNWYNQTNNSSSQQSFNKTNQSKKIKTKGNQNSRGNMNNTSQSKSQSKIVQKYNDVEPTYNNNYDKDFGSQTNYNINQNNNNSTFSQGYNTFPKPNNQSKSRIKTSSSVKKSINSIGESVKIDEEINESQSDPSIKRNSMKESEIQEDVYQGDQKDKTIKSFSEIKEDIPNQHNFKEDNSQSPDNYEFDHSEIKEDIPNDSHKGDKNYKTINSEYSEIKEDSAIKDKHPINDSEIKEDIPVNKSKGYSYNNNLSQSKNSEIKESIPQNVESSMNKPNKHAQSSTAELYDDMVGSESIKEDIPQHFQNNQSKQHTDEIEEENMPQDNVNLSNNNRKSSEDKEIQEDIRESKNNYKYSEEKSKSEDWDISEELPEGNSMKKSNISGIDNKKSKIENNSQISNDIGRSELMGSKYSEDKWVNDNQSKTNKFNNVNLESSNFNKEESKVDEFDEIEEI